MSALLATLNLRSLSKQPVTSPMQRSTEPRSCLKACCTMMSCQPLAQRLLLLLGGDLLTEQIGNILRGNGLPLTIVSIILLFMSRGVMREPSVLGTEDTYRQKHSGKRRREAGSRMQSFPGETNSNLPAPIG